MGIIRGTVRGYLALPWRLRHTKERLESWIIITHRKHMGREEGAFVVFYVSVSVLVVPVGSGS
jgi:hypothetical protein